MKMKIRTTSYGWKSVLLLLALIVGPNSIQRLSAQDSYAEAWQKVLKSQAWKDALNNGASQSTEKEEDLYDGEEEVVLMDDKIELAPEAKSDFETKYDFLVRRAYLKTIAEAEEADDRLQREYIIRNATALKKGKNRTKEFNEKLELVNKRYQAHRRMLEGLRSWNIFSEYGTNDLDFFKIEHQPAVKEMIRKGKKESTIVNYLIYKLADLYHFEEEL